MSGNLIRICFRAYLETNYFVLIYRYVSFIIHNAIILLYSQVPSAPISLSSKYSGAVERKLDRTPFTN